MGLVIPASLTVQRLLLPRFRHVSTRADRVATITRGEGGAVTAVKMRVKKRVMQRWVGLCDRELLHPRTAGGSNVSPAD